jgi:hypothetical protein
MWFHNNQKKTQSHDAHDFHINMWKSKHQDQIQSLNFPFKQITQVIIKLLNKLHAHQSLLFQHIHKSFLLYKRVRPRNHLLLPSVPVGSLSQCWGQGLVVHPYLHVVVVVTIYPLAHR